MRKNSIRLLSVFLILGVILIGYNQDKESRLELSEIKSPYLDQTPLGNTSEIFASGIISHGFHELGIAS